MMRYEMKRTRYALFLSPLLFVLGCAASGDDAQESTAQTADSLSATLQPDPGPSAEPRVVAVTRPSTAATVVGHKCNVLGSDGTTQGVHCADLAFVQNATGWEMWGVDEGLCQSPAGAEKQCAGIRENVGLFNPPNPMNPSGQLAGAQHNCGRFGGSACPATVRFQNSSGHFQLPFPPPGFCAEIWASMINDEIVLPGSAKTVGPGPNVASGHMQFCG
jgi:hypothetical protein